MTKLNDRRAELREELAPLWDNDRPLLDTALAPIVFVTVNAVFGLGWGAVAAVMAGFIVLGNRIRRGGDALYSIGGLVAVFGAIGLALSTGRAEGYFLPGIIGNAGLVIVGVVSITIRRPLMAYASRFLRRWPIEWYLRDDVRPAYTVVTWFWVTYWIIRSGTQYWLFVAEQPEALAAVRLGTSWPLGIPLAIASYVYGTHKLPRLGGPSVAEFESDASPPYESQRRGF